MPRPPLARNRAIDAFQHLLITEGERAATLEATAATAEVSKGGLLYHFASKDDLAKGLIERLESLVDEDIAAMAIADDGPLAAYLRTSVMTGDPLDRALIAVSRLAQGGSSSAAAALRRARERWAEHLRPHVRDETALHLVLLLSDGLYFNNALADAGTASVAPTGDALVRLIALVRSTVERAPHTP